MSKRLAWLLFAALSLHSEESPSCKLEQIQVKDKPIVWRIGLKDVKGHWFTAIQPWNSFDDAMRVCKTWLKAQTKIRPKKGE